MRNFTARNQKKEDITKRPQPMLEAVDDVQNKEDPVNNDEDQVDFTFRVPNRHIAVVEDFPESRTGWEVVLFWNRGNSGCGGDIHLVCRETVERW